ncbi:MAG TPA: DoxX family protein [Candidatus Acidoferrales bacterium]|nr:DoxX family protein [Candidatus Acidoferrales bacterium]
MVWAGRIMIAIVALFMIFDAVIHLMKIPPVVQAFAELSFPLSFAVTLGIIELFCVVLYVIPRTAILGAILLTAYLGGAISIQLRAGNPLFSQALFPVYVGVLAWGGLYLCDDRLRAMIPLRRAV